MILVDPVRLAHRQAKIDRERTSRYPHLFPHKAARMMASPFALLRGSAPLFYELLRGHPELAAGPGGEGWIVGDAHVENFGAYRAGSLTVEDTARSRAEELVVFGLNDFDDALVGPWRFDVLRLTTSVILAGRELGADGTTALAQCDALLDAYVGAVFGAKRAPTPPACVRALVEKVQRRTREQLLDARTHVAGKQRRFTLGPRYEALPPKLRVKAFRAFQKYAKRLPRSERIAPDALDVVDAAFRVAGTGSLGSLRVAVLTRGKGGVDGGWIFDMKAEAAPSAARLGRVPELAPAERVCTALRTCLARAPRMIGATRLRGASMFVRRLSPQEDKIDLTRMPLGEEIPLARHLGALLGQAHLRGAVGRPATPWTPKQCARLLDRAIALAGVHEATYLAYCDFVRR